MATPVYAEAPSVIPQPEWERLTISQVEPDEEACNCYLYARSKIGYLPLTTDLKPNAPCTTGAIAILRYGDLMHYAFISSDTKDTVSLDESNFRACQYTKRTIPRSDPHLEGCWFPG